jgi:hypothetical protein
VYAYVSFDLIVQNHRKAFIWIKKKYILDVKKSAASMMIYSELGRLPLEIQRTFIMVKYFFKLRNTDNLKCRHVQTKFQMLVFNHMGRAVFCWFYRIGLCLVWRLSVLLQLQQKLKDISIQNMLSFFQYFVKLPHI